jgi:hypothetical protein
MRVDRVVDRYGNSLTPGVKPIWAVDQGSGGHRLTHATSGGVRPAATRARRRSDGANATRRWGAPIAAGFSPGCVAAHAEH